MIQAQAGDMFISPAAADKLIAAHDGDVALLYIYALRTGSTDPELAARELCRTLSAVDDAEEKLRRLGLLPTGASVQPAAQPHPAPADELPEYRAEDIIRRTREDPGFAVVAAEAQKVLGHVLSSTDLRRLFGIYDYLSLPAEVILVLLNHCVACSIGRRPSMRYIEKEAYIWVNREIFTLDQAEEYILRSKIRREDISKAREALGIRDRELSATEAKYVSSWLDMGFREDAIAIAYDRTVTNTKSLKWNYIDKIFKSWHEKGLHTAADIMEKDSRRAPTPQSAKPGDSKPIDMGDLMKIMDKM